MWHRFRTVKYVSDSISALTEAQKLALGSFGGQSLPKRLLKEALGTPQMSQKWWVFDVSHFSDFIVFSGFAWEGVLILDICDFRVFA